MGKTVHEPQTTRKHAGRAVGLLFAATSYALAEEETTPIHGRQLMTQQEQYRARMPTLESDQERIALRDQHRKDSQTRAPEHGVELPDVAAPTKPAKSASTRRETPVLGRALMTEEERESHRQEMHSKTTAEEREEPRRENHEEATERARERDVELSDQLLPSGSSDGPGGDVSGGRRQVPLRSVRTV